jgi:mitogen-activated protein kinase organizer 1
MKNNKKIPKNFKSELIGHKAAIYVVKYSKDGLYCFSGSQDKTIKLWNPSKNLLVKSYDTLHSQDVLDVSISSDNSKMISAGGDKQVNYFDVLTGSVVRRFYGHTDRINSLAFNKLETVIVTGSYDCSVRIWDLKATSREPIQILNQAKDSISKVLILNDKIITGSVDNCVRMYDIRMGTLQIDNLESPINGMEISPDEKFLLVSCMNDSIKLFDLEHGETLKVYKGLHESRNYAMTVKFSIDNDYIITSSEDNNVVFYNLIDPDKNYTLKGHTKESTCVDTNPVNSGTIVSCGFDGRIIVWDSN